MADRKFAIGEYYTAADMYANVYKRLSATKNRQEKARVAFNQGECYRMINNPKAAAAYRNAIRYKYAIEQDSIVFLHQAQVLHYQGNYREAEKAYLLYLQGHDSSRVAAAGVYACRNAAEWKKQSSRYRIRIAKELNGKGKRYATFAPMFGSKDGSTIYFTSNRVQQNKEAKKKVRNSKITGMPTFNLWQSSKDSKGKWEAAELAAGLHEVDESDENSENSNDSTATKMVGQREMGICSITGDGQTMYFTFSCPENGKDLGAKIYVSQRASGAWAEAQELKLFADSSITVAHPAINQTGDTLYFVSDAPGGFGGKDIWLAVQNGEDWEVQNAGSKVNTAADEMFPYLHANGTLYFASNGHPGYGGLDLFYLDSIGDVYNMGQPFNGAGDDFGICFLGMSQDGFFSSNRGSRKGVDMLYEFQLPAMEFRIRGKVTDEANEPVNDAIVRLVGNDGTNIKQPARRDGTYEITLQRNTRYVMMVTARGYLNVSHRFDTKGLKDSKTYSEDFMLTSISKPIKMDNIFYEFGRWELTPESTQQMDQLFKLLTDNPNITIELSAHTDLVGDALYNLALSQKRAQSCVDYLIQKGIAKDRLTPVGYGKKVPVVADKELHKQYKWIPVDQELNDEFILSLKQDQQEICNRINRRTEFKVVKTTYGLY